MQGSSVAAVEGPVLAGAGDLDLPARLELLDAMRALEAELGRAEVAAGRLLEGLHPEHRQSGRNLLQYLTLRQHDVRALQGRLARLGLSSLGRSEAHVQRSVGQVRAVLETLAGIEPTPVQGPVGFVEGASLLEARAEALLGPRGDRPTRIMVTLPSEAAGDAALVEALVQEGMDCARINAAHDGPDDWVAMAGHVRRAAAEAGRICAVQVDLAGPKLRTGPVASRPGVVKLRVRRDDVGRVTGPARAWLDGGGPVPAGAPAVIPVPGDWVALLDSGTALHVSDARGAHRVLVVREPGPGGAWVECGQTAYLTAGTRLRPDGDRPWVEVGALPDREVPLVLSPGDTLVLSADVTGAVAAGPAGPARIGCTLPAVFDHVRAGDPIWFDDGRIGGVVSGVRPGEAEVTIHTASSQGSKLRGEKGINLPDTELNLPALTPGDSDALSFAAAHADLVALSFVQRPEDVTLLQAELAARGAADVGVVLKIETKQGFARLPELLLAALASRRVGVMIARGDLAVECGFERLAEVQEEILWLCEAAHVPVIWATQVLDQLARTGQPSRAEITDAARSVRAECVMLNKGPHILEAIATLDDILRRMSGHQQKRTPLLRQLHAWAPPVSGPARR